MSRYEMVPLSGYDRRSPRIRVASGNSSTATLWAMKLHQRFHGAISNLDGVIHSFLDTDFQERFSLVAERGFGDELRCVALASYFRISEGRAKMALVVDDELQGLGLGSILIKHLAEAAAEAGIDTFEAEVMAANSDMLEVLEHLDLPLERTVQAGVVHVEFPTSLTADAIKSFEHREAVSSAAGVGAIDQASVGRSDRRFTTAGINFCGNIP